MSYANSTIPTTMCTPMVVALISAAVSTIMVFTRKIPKFTSTGKVIIDCNGNQVYTRPSMYISIIFLMMNIVYIAIMYRICSSYSKYKGVMWGAWFWLFFGMAIVRSIILTILIILK
jgi:hypothetical protein